MTTTTSRTTEEQEVDEFIGLLVWLYEHRANVHPEAVALLLRSGVGDGFYLKRVKHDNDNKDIVDIIAVGVEAVEEEEKGEEYEDHRC
jgi:gamma-glutamyl phosphate reductase